MRVISVQPKKGHLALVTFDDETVGEIDTTVWERSGYAQGSDIGAGEWEALTYESERFRAKSRALYYLSARDYGCGEMAEKLVRAGFGREIAQSTAEELAAGGLIDDGAYARRLAADMASRKFYPNRRIAIALSEKGFSGQTVRLAVDGLPDNETDRALELLRKKRYNNLSDAAVRQKALGMLSRYGFSYSDAKAAAEALAEETRDREEL